MITYGLVKQNSAYSRNYRSSYQDSDVTRIAPKYPTETRMGIVPPSDYALRKVVDGEGRRPPTQKLQREKPPMGINTDKLIQGLASALLFTGAMSRQVAPASVPTAGDGPQGPTDFTGPAIPPEDTEMGVPSAPPTPPQTPMPGTFPTETNIITDLQNQLTATNQMNQSLIEIQNQLQAEKARTEAAANENAMELERVKREQASYIQALRKYEEQAKQYQERIQKADNEEQQRKAELQSLYQKERITLEELQSLVQKEQDERNVERQQLLIALEQQRELLQRTQMELAGATRGIQDREAEIQEYVEEMDRLDNQVTELKAALDQALRRNAPSLLDQAMQVEKDETKKDETKKDLTKLKNDFITSFRKKDKKPEKEIITIEDLKRKRDKKSGLFGIRGEVGPAIKKQDISKLPTAILTNVPKQKGPQVRKSNIDRTMDSFIPIPRVQRPKAILTNVPKQKGSQVRKSNITLDSFIPKRKLQEGVRKKQDITAILTNVPKQKGAQVRKSNIGKSMDSFIPKVRSQRKK